MELKITLINNLITFWRREKTVAQSGELKEDEIKADIYIDAYQTVRVNHGLERLPLNSGD